MTLHHLAAGAGLLAALCGSASASSVYLGDVWPYQVVRVGDRLEYSYDLTAVKAGQVSSDVKAEAGEDEVKAFLKALPREVKTSVEAGGAIVALGAVPGLEHAPLSASFAASPSGALAARSVLARDPGARALPALHPDSPKVLVSLDLVLWKARAVENGALVAIERAAESGKLGLPLGRKELWDRIFTKALARARSQQGDAKEGALALAARIGAARCLNPSSLPANLRSPPSLAKAVKEEIERLREVEPRLVPQGPWLWTPELRCMYWRDQVLSEPMPSSRGGTAAVLTLFRILDSDPKLAKTYAALEALRDTLHGRPGVNPLPQYRTAVGAEGIEAALDNLASYFQGLEAAGVNWADPRPGLFAKARTPISHFLEGLQPAERANAMDELALAIQDGRVPLAPDEKGAWAVFRDAALVPLLRPEAEGGLAGNLVVDEAYRSRLLASFQGLRGAHREGKDEGSTEESAAEGAGHPELKVQLMVPPHLEIEPLPAAYARAVSSLRRLEQYLGSNPRAAALSGVTAEGGTRPGTLRAEISQMKAVLRGLELLSMGVAGPGAKASDSPEDAQAVAGARRLLASWRSDLDLARDARAIEGSAALGDGAMSFSGIFGVGRRELRASFSQKPKVKISGYPEGGGPFVAGVAATQKYLVPVLATGSAAPLREPAKPRAWGEVAAPNGTRLQALCEKAGRLRDAIEAALPEALSGAE